METVMGFPKSLPPVMRKPQGAGPARVTVTGMAAGGSGRAGSGSVRKPRGAKGTRQRGPPLLPPRGTDRPPETPPWPRPPKGPRHGADGGLPSGEGTHVLARSLGAGSHRCFLLPPRCPRLRLAASSPPGMRGSRAPAASSSGAAGGMGQARSPHRPPGPCARQEIRATLASEAGGSWHGTAKPAGFGGEDVATRAASGRPGKDPAAHRDGVQTRSRAASTTTTWQTRAGKGC